MEFLGEENYGLQCETENQVGDLMEFSYSEANLKISLHAITGSGHPKTTRIVGKVGNPRVVILIPTIFWTHPL